MSIATDNSQQIPYAGWVPTVSGSLSFRHVGEANHPTPSIYANVAVGNTRLIVAYQRRPLSDILFAPILHFLLRISGSFWFVVAASGKGEPGSANKLEGKVHIYKTREDWRQRAEEQIRPRILEINELRLADDQKAASERIQAAYDETVAALEATSDIQLEFELDRSGEVSLTRPTYRDADLQYMSEQYASALAQDFPKWIADQSYFFLRDITHRHQHHRANEDTILILQSRDQEGVRWRQNIIYSLYYQIIRAKRANHGYSNIQAKGILGYCMSFKAICKRQLGSVKLDALSAYNDDALIASIDAKIEEDNARDGTRQIHAGLRSQTLTNGRVYILALVAIFIAIFSALIQNRIINQTSYPVLRKISDYSAEHFVGICGLTLLFILGFWSFTSRAIGGFVYDHLFGRDVLELSNAGRGLLVVLYPILACAIVGGTIYLGWPAVRVLIDGATALWNAIN